MDLRTKLATAFTAAVVIAVFAWTAASPQTHSYARRTFNRVDRTKSAVDGVVRSSAALWALPDHVHQPTQCNVKLLIDPTLASHAATTGGSGRFNKGERRFVAEFAFDDHEIRCGARATDDGSVALWMWLGDGAASEWYEFVLPPNSSHGSMLTAESSCFVNLRKFGADHGDQIHGCPFERIEGTLLLRSVPLVPGERVPFELALRVDRDGDKFDWTVETAAEVLVER